MVTFFHGYTLPVDGGVVCVADSCGLTVGAIVADGFTDGTIVAFGAADTEDVGVTVPRSFPSPDLFEISRMKRL